MRRRVTFPDFIDQNIKRLFSENRWDWSSKKLADDILKLSDFYIQNPHASTPWSEPWAQRALLVYFWPLNTARFVAIHQELKSLQFFQDLNGFVDFGAGPGTAAWILSDHQTPVELVESSQIPQKWFPQFRWQSEYQVKPQTCSVFCYSLTELRELPNEALKSEALIILEPATQQDGRNLLELRKSLLSAGFSVWAPCFHQEPCPLLSHSKTDWCHDRVQLESPDWFQEIERHLPMKNKTITMSYLALRKKSARSFGLARLTGDQLVEKGKTRQLVCRGPEREFLAWMHRDGEPPELFRGEKVSLLDFDKKSNELRIKKLERID